LHVFLGLDIKSFFPMGVRDPIWYNVIGSHKCSWQIASKSVKRYRPKVNDCHKQMSDNRQTGRQTDHVTDKCVAIAGIACSGGDFAE